MSVRVSLAALTVLVVVIGACATASPGGGNVDAGPGGNTDGSTIFADANDSDAAKEICNGKDDNGNGFIDEGTAEQLCGMVANGTPICNGAGGCGIASCDAGWYDIDGLFNDGCECTVDANENGSQNCGDYVEVGSINDDGTKIVETGNIVPVGDVDYYDFTAVDSPDNTCDNFHVRVYFLSNPNNEFTLSMWKGGCSGQEICSGNDDLDWYTDFQSTGETPPTGECPCTPLGTGTDDTTNQCVDDTSEFVVMVSRNDGVTPTCNDYQIEISNGAYPPPP